MKCCKCKSDVDICKDEHMWALGLEDGAICTNCKKEIEKTSLKIGPEYREKRLREAGFYD